MTARNRDERDRRHGQMASVRVSRGTNAVFMDEPYDAGGEDCLKRT
jgi:hypothetical protein